MPNMNFATPNWSQYSRAYARNAMQPIQASILENRKKAVLIRAGNRTAWLPRAWVTHDPETGIFWVPSWLAEQKRLT